MKKNDIGAKFISALFLIGISLLLPAVGSATFSIVAVDTITGAVGGAGASCIANSVIINDVIEGIGAAHTQAYYLSQNQANAHTRLAAGWAPDSIINWLATHDIENSPEYRQYGIVTLAGPGKSAGYTGSLNTYWAGHLTGPGYSIQGNILVEGWLLDSMQAAYLRTSGPLEEKLMAAIDAANVPGADTRCYAICNKPAISAFIKVVHIGDGGTPHLFLDVNNTICQKNPLDSLRQAYDAWVERRYADSELSTVIVTPMTLPADDNSQAIITIAPRNYLNEPPLFGSEVVIEHFGSGTLSAVTDNGDGSFAATLTAPAVAGRDSIVVNVTAAEQTVTLIQRPVVIYYPCGDANGNGIVNIQDITFLINCLYKSGPPPVPLSRGDANGNGLTNIQDITYLINFLYKSGPAPQCP